MPVCYKNDKNKQFIVGKVNSVNEMRQETMKIVSNKLHLYE